MKKEIEIKLGNVRELWELYEYYLEEFRKSNYSYIEPLKFEEFVQGEVTICSNCNRYILQDNLGISELAIQDNVCEDCIEGGYGA